MGACCECPPCRPGLLTQMESMNVLEQLSFHSPAVIDIPLSQAFSPKPSLSPLLPSHISTRSAMRTATPTCGTALAYTGRDVMPRGGDATWGIEGASEWNPPQAGGGIADAEHLCVPWVLPSLCESHPPERGSDSPASAALHLCCPVISFVVSLALPSLLPPPRVQGRASHNGWGARCL